MMKQVNFLPLRMLTFIFGLILSTGAFAQQITVNGHVKDGSGEDIIGATVRIIGQDGGVVTDFDGNFTIQANQGATLSIAYIGYETVTVAAAPNVEVLLKEEAAKSLNEIVVIGYGVAKKNDLTGSVTAIKPDDKNHGLITNAQDMMQGKIAGVNVTTDGGAPGTGASIRIRGGSSLNASNDPLIVIDGLAMDNQGVKGLSNPLSMVNPNDIESFTVLKDASATAIYGSRGSNGVIIITTKKGRKGMKPQVSYSGNISYSVKKKTVDVLNATEYRNFIKNYYGEGSGAWNLLGQADTNWQEEIYRPAVSADHNVTIQGGAKNMPYRISVGYTDQNGILKTSNFQRTTASVSLNPSLLQDHLKFNINGKFMYAHNRYAHTNAISSATRMDPTHSVHDTNAKFNNFHGYFTWTDDGTSLGNTNYPLIANRNAVDNPVAQLYEKNDRANSFDYIANVEIDYAIHGFEDLHLHANLSGNWANGRQDTDYSTWGPTNFYYGNTGYSLEKKYNLVGSAYAQYMKDFAKTQHINLMVGYEMSDKKFWGDSFYYQPTLNVGKSEAQIRQEIANGTLPTGNSVGSWKQPSRLQSYFARFNYTAFDRYMLTATFRADGSSRFSKDNRWGYFPSVALAWKINEEAFLRNATWLDDLKLRIGWGKTGQQDGISNFAYLASYNVNVNNTDGRYPLKGVNDSGLLYRPDAYNSKIKWETTTTSNIGLDIALFRNRVSASVDYYYRKTTDLLNISTVSAGSNFKNQVLSNIGSLENRGVEASLTVRPVQTKDWQWEVSANFTYNKNKITELTGESAVVTTGAIPGTTDQKAQAHAVGRPANSFYVFQQVYDEAGKPVEGVYVDRNSDGKITDADRYFYKSPAAPYIAGLSSRLQYRKWDFGFSLRASFDNYVFNNVEAGFRNVAKRYDSSFSYLQNATPKSIKNNWQTYECITSDHFVENASFLKLDNVTLGYSFSNWFKGGSYNGLSGRLYLAATNVCTFTKYSGLDPEVGSGIDSNAYPRPFTLQMGVNINF